MSDEPQGPDGKNTGTGAAGTPEAARATATQEPTPSRSGPLDAKANAPLAASAEPPVVARLMIEIRSDGSRTIARGIAEDVERGERVSLEASGATPLGLALSLLAQLNRLPTLARGFARNLLGGPKK